MGLQLLWWKANCTRCFFNANNLKQFCSQHSNNQGKMLYWSIYQFVVIEDRTIKRTSCHVLRCTLKLSIIVWVYKIWRNLDLCQRSEWNDFSFITSKSVDGRLMHGSVCHCSQYGWHRQSTLSVFKQWFITWWRLPRVHDLYYI